MAMMVPSSVASRYGPLTKSIDIDEALQLIDLTRELKSVAAWQDEALYRLPQASRQRRQEIVRAVQQKFLQTEGDRFVATPLITLLTAPLLESRLKRDLLLAQYLRTTPLVWEALREVVLPYAEANDPEIPQVAWDALLESRLRAYTESTFSRTRRHITAHLTKFGLLEVRDVPGNRIAKRFFARFYEPDPRAFWFSLALEFAWQGWSSRSLDFITTHSWTRVAYCAKPAYVRFVMAEAERSGLIVTDFYGSEKQCTFRGPDAAAQIAEALRYG